MLIEVAWTGQLQHRRRDEPDRVLLRFQPEEQRVQVVREGSGPQHFGGSQPEHGPRVVPASLGVRDLRIQI